MENVAEEAVAGSVLVFEKGTYIFPNFRKSGSHVFLRKLFFLHRCQATNVQSYVSNCPSIKEKSPP